MDIIVDEVPTLDSLKNPNNLSLEVEDVVPVEEKPPETHLEYKKRLNKKVSEFTEDEKKEYNRLSQSKKRKEVKFQEAEDKKEEDNIEETKKINNLYNQLFVLKKKFPEHLDDIHINKEMNINTLNEKKDLIMKIITQKNSDAVIFETLLLGCRTIERGLNYAEIEALDGYADNVNESRDDIIPILKEMIDLGEIDTSMLTPQLRLMIVMSSVAVKTVEKNNDKKKNEVIAGALDTS
jgi:hypothetical protein